MIHLFWLLACAKQKIYLQSFEEVWTTVDETYPYEDFSGVDWQEQHDIYEKKIKKAKDDDTFHLYLDGLLETLGVSHMSILPKELYEDESEEDESEEDQIGDGGQNDNSDVDGDTNSEKNYVEKGWVGLDARWIEDKLIITKIHPDMTFPEDISMKMGLEVTHIDGRNIQDFAKRFSNERERGFAVGRYSISKFSGDLNETLSLTLRESDDTDPYKVNLTYQNLNTITSKKQFNLPSSVVQFDHYVLEEDLYYVSSNIFLMPIRDQIEEAFQNIVKNQPKGLIIDLRGNPGGFIDLGVFLSSFIISEKNLDLGTQISRDGTIYLTIYPRLQSQRYDGSVVVLVDELSASTSEVVAGGLQELGRVTVVGQISAGKALPSMVKNLSNGDRFQYVVADLRTPKGNQFEENGVVPNVIVERKRMDYIDQRDPELEVAITFLREQSLNTFEQEE